MQTPEQLREQAARLREAGTHAERYYGAAELAKAKRLEQSAAELEAGSQKDLLNAMDAELRRANAAMRRAQSRVGELETMLGGLLGQPVADRSPAWIAGRLNEWRKS